MNNYCQLSKLRKGFGYVLAILLVWSYGCGEKAIEWTTIELKNSSYTFFATGDTLNIRFPASNLFDADITTCYVTGSTEVKTENPIYVMAPGDPFMISIFSGYGKSRDLHEIYGRPEKIRLSLYAAILEKGSANQDSLVCKAAKFPDETVIELRDVFDIQHIPVRIDTSAFNHFKKRVEIQQNKEFPGQEYRMRWLIKLTITDVFEGLTSPEVCISELFFNDRYTPGYTQTDLPTSQVYINSEGNALLKDNRKEKGTVVYSDTASVLKIDEFSKDNTWIILTSVPVEAGRNKSLGAYLLVNTRKNALMNEKLRLMNPDYTPGTPLSFMTGSNNELLLVSRYMAGKSDTIEIR